MSILNIKLTTSNAENGSLVAPDRNWNGYDYYSIGNNPDGLARFYLLRLPLSPLSGKINSAILKLAQYNDSNSNTKALPAKVSPVTGTWSQSTRFDNRPAINTSVVDLRTFDETLPGSGNYDYRTGYHAAKYTYRRYYGPSSSGPWTLGWTDTIDKADYDNYYSTWGGTQRIRIHPDSMEWTRDIISKTAAYYDTYVKYRTVDITKSVQWLVDNNKDSIMIYFDLPGTKSTRKYFKSVKNANINLQPSLMVDYLVASIRAKVSGAWQSKSLFAKVGTIPKQAKNMLAKVSGVWKQTK